MPAIPAGFYNAEFIFNVGGSIRDVTWGLGIDYSGTPAGDPAAVAEIVYNSFSGASGPYVATKMQVGWTFQGVQVSFQDEDGPLVAQYLDPVAGSASGTTVPVNCAILASKNTGLGGRRNRGRAYLPPLNPSETSIDNVGVINGAALAEMQGWYDDALTILPVGDCVPVLFHQSAPFTPTPVTGLQLSSLLATQRRRMRS